MSPTASHRKAPLRTYGGNRRGRFAIFRDSNYAAAKGLEKHEAEAGKGKLLELLDLLFSFAFPSYLCPSKHKSLRETKTGGSSFSPSLRPGGWMLICRSAEADTKIAPEHSVDLKTKLGIRKLKTNLPNDTAYEDVDSPVEIAQRKLLEIPSQAPTYAVANLLPTGPGSKETDVKIIMKLKEKPTNTMVNPALVRALPLQTPATHSIKAQFPKTPPKKKPKADISLKRSPSPSRRRARPSFTGIWPTLEDQDFPNILSPSASRAHSKRLSTISANSASITAATSQWPVHEPPQNSGISEQILVKSPSLSFLDKAKEVVTDTTRAAVKLLPVIVQSKTKKVPKKKARIAKRESVGSTVESKWKAFGKGTNIRSREYEEVVDPTDSEDLREGNITRTWKYSTDHRALGAEESHQNLLYGPTSESDADEGEASVGSPEIYEASDVEMITDSNSTFNPNATPHPKRPGKRFGKYTKDMHRQEPSNDDTEQGFDGDVEMLTGENDYDLGESSGLNTRGSSRILDSFLPWVNTPRKGSDGNVTLTLEGGMTTKQLDVKVADVRCKVFTPLHMKKYDELMAMEIEMATKKRKLENSPIRSSYGVKRKYSTAKISLIGGPPGDLSNLSEDELCSPHYMIVPFAARYDQDKTPSKTRNIKGRMETRATRRILNPATDRMETD